MSTEPVPSPRGRYLIEEIDDECLIYRMPIKTAIYLNDTATVIWRLCDGTRTARQIATILAEAYPDQAETILGDVQTTIDELIKAQALQLVDRRTGAEPVVRVRPE